MRWPWKKKELTNSDWLGIVQAYGGVLETASVGVGGSRSEADLPFPKHVIKAALVAAAKQPGISAEQLNALGVGFVELAAFVPNGGSPGPLQNLPNDVAKLSKEELHNLARTIADSGNGDGVVGAMIASEAEILLAEWQSLNGEAKRHA